MSEIGKGGGKPGGKMDAKPETKQRRNYARDPKNKDGLESKWQHAANKQVDDSTGSGTTVRACVKGANKQVGDVTGNGTTVRACVKAAKAATRKLTMTPAKGPR
jgi:alkaline phosphatase